MNPFINLKRSSQYGGVDTYYVNVHHIVRVLKSPSGSQVYTIGGDFYCDEKPDVIARLIDRVYE